MGSESRAPLYIRYTCVVLRAITAVTLMYEAGRGKRLNARWIVLADARLRCNQHGCHEMSFSCGAPNNSDIVSLTQCA